MHIPAASIKCPNCAASLRPEDLTHPSCQFCGAVLLIEQDGELINVQSLAARQDSALTNARINSDIQLIGVECYRTKYRLDELEESLKKPIDSYLENLTEPRQSTPTEVPSFIGSLFKGIGMAIIYGWIVGIVFGILALPFHKDLDNSTIANAIGGSLAIAIIVSVYGYAIWKALRPWNEARTHNKTIEQRYSAAMAAYKNALGPARKRAAEAKHQADERFRKESAALRFRVKALESEEKRMVERLGARKLKGLT